MTDLINDIKKLNPKIFNDLYIKYQKLIPVIDNNILPEFIYIIDIAYNHINSNYKSETPDWKAWCVLLVKEIYTNGIINSLQDINDLIDLFLKYKKKEYNKYISDIALYSSEYHRDYGFINQFIKQL